MKKTAWLREARNIIAAAMLVVGVLQVPVPKEQPPCLFCDPCKCKPGRQCGCLEIPPDPEDGIIVLTKYVPPRCPCAEGVCTCKLGSQCGCKKMEE